MGSGQSVYPQTDIWRHPDWQNVPNHSLNFGQSATLRNIKTGSLVDEYQLSWQNKQEYQFYLKSFNWRTRKRNSGPIVSSVGIQELSKDGLCSGRWAANIYLEHIGVRLSQIQDVPLSDSLFILLEALTGFEQLYHHSGYFRVEEEQICVDKGGRVRVWVNGNLSKNYPQTDAETECLRRDETHMVRQLVDLVQSNADLDENPHQLFSSFLSDIRRREGSQVGFQRAHLAVLDYARTYKIMIPHRIEAALELYQHQETKISINHMAEPFRPFDQRMRNLSDHSNCYSSPNLQSTTFHSLPSQSQFQRSGPYNHPNHHHPHENYQSFEPVTVPVSHITSFARQLQGTPISPTVTIQEEQQISGSAVRSQTKINCHQTSRHTTNTKSFVANLEDTAENFSGIVIDESPERSLGGSQRGPYSCQNEKGKDWIRYSQQIQDNYTQYEFNSFKFNRDTFGLSPQRRLMKESSSSYRIPSSNSSKSPGRFSKRSQRSSKKESAKGSSRKSQMISERWWLEKDRYFVNLGDECQLDPDIAADIAKYLG